MTESVFVGAFQKPLKTTFLVLSKTKTVAVFQKLGEIAPFQFCIYCYLRQIC